MTIVELMEIRVNNLSATNIKLAHISVFREWDTLLTNSQQGGCAHRMSRPKALKNDSKLFILLVSSNRNVSETLGLILYIILAANTDFLIVSFNFDGVLAKEGRVMGDDNTRGE